MNWLRVTHQPLTNNLQAVSNRPPPRSKLGGYSRLRRLGFRPRAVKLSQLFAAYMDMDRFHY